MTVYQNPPYPPTTSKHPRVGVACIVEVGGKVLLGKRRGSHGGGSWGFPGGHLEFGEEVLTCAQRELLEETDLVSLEAKQGPWVENVMDEGQKHYITIFVFIKKFSGLLVLKEPNKCEGWGWFSWDALPTPLFAPIPSYLDKVQLTTPKK